MCMYTYAVWFPMPYLHMHISYKDLLKSILIYIYIYTYANEDGLDAKVIAICTVCTMYLCMYEL